MVFSFRSQVSVSRYGLANNYRAILLVFFCFLFSFNAVFAQFNIPKKPSKTSEQTSVYDYVNLLSASEKSSLEQKLLTYSDSTSTQIVIAIINSTEGENINYLGAQWGQAWGIGQAGKDNGILILLAKNDRKIAINSGYGVEHLLTDAMCKRITERDIIPFFKQNYYCAGLNRGADAIFEVLKGEYKETRKADNTNDFPVGFIVLIILFIIIMAISKNKRGGGGNRGNNSGDISIWDAIILSNMGRSSGGFGGGSSGGSFGGGGGFGGGFGGGGFGGGGASGGW